MYQQSNLSYVSTRAVYDLSGGIAPPIEDCVVVCMPSLGWSIARSLLEAYGKRAVQFASEYQDTYYVNLSTSDWDEVQSVISEVLGACVMSCDELVVAINGIAIAVAQNACVSGGASGAGGTSDPADPFEDDGVNFPAPFDDRPDYLVWKCKRANIIVSGIQSDVQFIDDTPVVSLVAPFLVAALLTPIPFDDVATIVGMMALWALEGLLDAYLAELTAFLSANEEDLICALYEATSATAARDDFLSLAGSLTFPAQTLLSFFMSFTNTNSLFEESGVWGSLPNTTLYDCADCAVLGCWCDTFTQTGVDDGGGNWSSEDAGFAHGVSIFVNSDGVDPCTDTCGPETNMDIVSLVGHTTTPATDDFQINGYSPCTVPVSLYSSNTQWPNGSTGRTFQIWSLTPFTVEFGC